MPQAIQTFMFCQSGETLHETFDFPSLLLVLVVSRFFFSLTLVGMELLIPALSVLFCMISTLAGYLFGRVRGRKDQNTCTVFSDQPQPVTSVAARPKYNAQPPPVAAMVAQPKEEANMELIITKRIKLFESIQAQQKAHIQSLPSESIK